MAEPSFSGSFAYDDVALGEVWVFVRVHGDCITVGITHRRTDFELTLSAADLGALVAALTDGPLLERRVITDQEDLVPALLTAQPGRLQVQLRDAWTERFTLGDRTADAVALLTDARSALL